MTPTELMKPRYKVIADWPDNSKHKIGNIINAGNVEWPENYCEWLDNFPHLFKKLEWWEERNENELPAWIKCNSRSDDFLPFGIVGIALRWAIEREIVFINFKDNACWIKNYIPACEADFINQSPIHYPKPPTQ